MKKLIKPKSIKEIKGNVSVEELARIYGKKENPCSCPSKGCGCLVGYGRVDIIPTDDPK